MKIGFATPLLLLACQSEEKREAKRLADNAASAQRANLAAEQKRNRLLAKSDNTVLHHPVRQEPSKSLLKNKYGNICFKFGSLPHPWFLVDNERHGRIWYSWGWNASPSEENWRDVSPEFLIVAEASKIDIPFYTVDLSRPVEYDFVSPFQEYVYVWVTSTGPEFDKNKYFKRISKFNSRQKRSKDGPGPPYIKSEYDFIPHKKWPLTHYSWNFGDGKSMFLSINENLTLAISGAGEITQDAKKVFKTSLRPTDDFYKTPTVRGAFLHESEKVVVNYEASLLSLPHSPRLLNEIEIAVSSLISDCG